jgi:hypothetical protein
VLFNCRPRRAHYQKLNLLETSYPPKSTTPPNIRLLSNQSPVGVAMTQAVCCLLFAVCCLLFAVCCLLSAACCLLSAVCFSSSLFTIHSSLFLTSCVFDDFAFIFCSRSSLLSHPHIALPNIIPRCLPVKRCSQCDFTFSDDHQFCDFDYTELTVIPDPAPSTQNVAAFFPTKVRRIVRSRPGLAVLALAGVALLVGYFDSVQKSRSDVVSSSENRGPSNLTGQAPREKSEQTLIEPVTKPRSISTQRKLRANESGSSMPSSILKWKSPLDGESVASRVTPSRLGPRRVNSTSKRGAASNMASKRKAAKSNNAIAQNYKSTRDGTRDRKSSKVVAILKKTGSILTKPFRL